MYSNQVSDTKILKISIFINFERLTEKTGSRLEASKL